MVVASEALAKPRDLHIVPFAAVGFWGGIAGAVSAVVLIVYPPAVPAEKFSYPFNGMGFTLAQLFFALQHVTIVLLLVALLRALSGRARLARGGLIIAIAGLVMLGALELIAIMAADSVVGEPLYDTMSVLHGIPSILTAIGLVLGGIGIIRARAWQGRRRFLPLVLGLYVFVPLLPALMGPNWTGRVALGIWCLLFALLGWTLWHGPRRPGPAEQPRRG